jgi:hypothetical protein
VILLPLNMAKALCGCTTLGCSDVRGWLKYTLWLIFFFLLSPFLFVLGSLECESSLEAQAQVSRAQKKATLGTWAGRSQGTFVDRPTTVPAVRRGAWRQHAEQAA